ncbi:gag-protease polyprotein [Trifolium repens]|nr:gag-protease polyprotein [Trifolium repens]
MWSRYVLPLLLVELTHVLIPFVLNFLVNRAIASDRQYSFWLSSDLKAKFFIFLSGLSSKVISKVCSEPMSSSTFIVLKSCDSSIAVTFIENLLGSDLRIFLASFSSGIFSPRAKHDFAMSRTLVLNSEMVSSSSILRFSNFDVRSCSFDILTLKVPSCAICRISQACLASVHVLINLNMFSSTPLKIALSALELLLDSVSSSGVQSLSSFSIEEPSSAETIG